MGLFYSVYMEITNQCNLNCASCYNASGCNRTRMDLPLHTIQRAVSVFESFGCKRFLFSGGEPTLYQDWDALMEWVRSRTDLTFCFITNGTTEKAPLLVEAARELDYLEFMVSLDGSCEEVNRLTRGPGSFDKAWETVMGLAQTGRKLTCKMVLSSYTGKDVSDFYNRVIEAGALPEFAFLNRMGNGSRDWEAKALGTAEKLEILHQIEDLNKRHSLKVPVPFATDGCPFAGDCEGLSPLVKPDGTLMPCQLIYDDKYSLCNVKDMTADDLTKQIERFSDRVGKRPQMDYSCYSCILREACKKGCPALAILRGGELLDNDGMCEMRRLQFVQFALKEHLNELVKT